MTYKGYKITANVRCFQIWSVDDNGDLVEFLRDDETTWDDNDISYMVSKDGGYVEYFNDFEEAKQEIDKLVLTEAK